RLVFPSSPYGFSAIGTEASNKAITRGDLTGFLQKAYVPSNAVLAIAGDLTLPQAKELATKYFGAWVGAASAAASLATPAPPARSIAIVDKPGAPQTFLLAAGLGAKRSTPDYVPL